jgi:hypothetical protein
LSVVEDGQLVDVLTITDMLGVLLRFLPRATPQPSPVKVR